MNKVTIYIKQKKFLYALLRNSIYIPSDRDVEDIPTIIIKNILSKSGIRYIKTYEDDDSNIIITDDILIAKTIPHKQVIFISPIDYNVIDGFLIELSQATDLVKFNQTAPLDFLKENYPNLKLISPTLIEHPNLTFDLSLVLNYNLYDDKWGAIHYNARHLFKVIQYKPYRVEYSIREIRKINRIKLFLELIDSDLTDNIKLTVHNLFLYDTEMYAQSKKYFEDNERGAYFEKLLSLNPSHYSDDELVGGQYTHQVWPMGKLVNHTLKSDIALYNESSPEEDSYSSMDYLITEKTIDLLSIGKPFIYNSKIVDRFNLRYGFIDYNRTIFNDMGDDMVSIIKTISDMNIREYEELIGSLKKISHQNLKKLEEYKGKNTFLYNLIHN
jgi:hypothetical protein